MISLAMNKLKRATLTTVTFFNPFQQQSRPEGGFEEYKH
jgi:hypothetical protein